MPHAKLILTVTIISAIVSLATIHAVNKAAAGGTLKKLAGAS